MWSTCCIIKYGSIPTSQYGEFDSLVTLFKPKECGIATLDEDGKVVHFVEKPENPESDLANAGIYIMKTALINEIPDKPLADFGFDLIPNLVGKMYGYPIPDYYIDIGTFERLEKARAEWPEFEKARGLDNA